MISTEIYIEDNFKMFLNIYDIYKLENPDAKPTTDSYPTTVKLIP